MTGYLIWVGVPLSVIGIFRAISSIIGILGTVAFHISSYSHGLAKTGMWSITFQFACLSLSIISFLFQNHMVLHTFSLVFGVCVSRIGLWTFDLTITQYMQQLIPSPIRGEMGGVQNSLEGLFEILTFVMGIYFPSARQFVILGTQTELIIFCCSHIFVVSFLSYRVIS
jgi:iron-regulated transporter 1